MDLNTKDAPENWEDYLEDDSFIDKSK